MNIMYIKQKYKLLNIISVDVTSDIAYVGVSFNFQTTELCSNNVNERHNGLLLCNIFKCVHVIFLYIFK